MGEQFTIIDETRPVETEVHSGTGDVRLTPAALHEALGWELKPEGFCRGETCVPAGNAHVLEDGLVQLEAFASLMGRPLVIDIAERVAALGASPDERGTALMSGTAPDFELPDLTGRTHRLSEHRGKKVLLAAWASW